MSTFSCTDDESNNSNDDLDFLTLYADYMSQPSRACAMFIRMVNLPVKIELVKLHKREHKSAPFLRVNKFGQVPALVERTQKGRVKFVLSESSAILKYLSEKYPSIVSESKMYSDDLREKAKIWSALDWYQTTIRSSAAGVSWHAFVAGNMGGKVSLELAKHYEERLKMSLDVLETLRLGDTFPFLNEREHPSIADLLVIEDIVNLVVLKGSPFREELSSLDQLLAERPRVRKWRDAVMRINKPIWDEIHGVLEMVAENASKKIDSESKPKSSESSPKFSTGFPDISAAKHASNENERLWKLTNGRKKLNIVLITCEFDGPTNNGGIGTQFTALAKLYAKNGNSVTVVFTEGERSQNKPFSHWEKFYREEHDIELVGLYRPNKNYIGRHLLESHEVYKYLKTHEHVFDVAHFHDYRGAAYYSLLAKTQGLFLRNLLIVVQTHGNNKWAKVVGNDEVLGDVGELEMDFMERRAVKLADYVVSPSRYLLEWMRRESWAENTNGEAIVHPNLLPEESRRGRRKGGRNSMSSDSNSDNDYSDNDDRNAEEVGDEKRRSAVMVDELVFFGRLETRKGVVEFCDAVDILLKNETMASMISKITFLGRAASVLGQNGHEFGSKEAKAYLKSPAANRKGNKRKLAVLPSLIENSPYAVYECAELGIPFLASDVGGTRDLLREEDRAMSLIGYSEEDTYHEKMAMTGELLANRIREVLEKGALSARPRYDAAENDEKWLRWTTHVVVEYKSKRGGLNVASNYRDDDNSVVFLKDTNIEAKDLPFVSIVMTHYDRPRLCKVAIQSVIDQDYPHEKFEFILVDDKSPSHEAQLFLDSLEADFRKRNWKIVRNKENVYLGGARNVGFKHAKGKYVMFMDDDNYAKPHELRTFVVAMENGNADVLTSLVQFFWSHDNPLKAREIVDDEPSYLFLGGDAETGAFKNCFGDANCCVRATSFEKIGGYTEDKQIGFEDWEMYANASMRGFQVDIVPESVYYYRFSQGSMQRTTDYLINRKRSLRPYLRTLPKAMHSNLLKAAFPKASNNKNKQNIGKPSGMMAQGDARFHGVDEDTLIREGERQRREQEENFGHVEL
ncbi:unnamed protein product [Bathycoccus prasinos]